MRYVLSKCQSKSLVISGNLSGVLFEEIVSLSGQ